MRHWRPDTAVFVVARISTPTTILCRATMPIHCLFLLLLLPADVDNCVASGCRENAHPNRSTGHTVGYRCGAAAVHAVAGRWQAQLVGGTGTHSS
jgi:hypothetical protein